MGATIRHLTSGRLAPVIAHVRTVTQQQYDAHTAAAIQHGVDSIIAVLRRDPAAIPNAFKHPRLGPIGLDFDGAKHIVDQRMQQYPGDDSEATTAKVLLAVATAAIMGRLQEDLGPFRVKNKPESGRLPSRIAIVHDEHEVIVEPTWRTNYPELAKGQTTWLVTGYRMTGNRKPNREAEKDSMALQFKVVPAAAKGPKK